jgi:hypothetical protein
VTFINGELAKARAYVAAVEHWAVGEANAVRPEFRMLIQHEESWARNHLGTAIAIVGIAAVAFGFLIGWAFA